MASQAETEQRLEMLAGLKAQGYAYSQLVRLSCQQWQISERQAKRYLHEIAQRELALASGDTRDYLGRFMARNHYLYAKAVQNNQWDLARKLILDEVRAIETLKKNPGGTPLESISTGSPGQTDELADLYSLLETEGLTG